MTVVIDVPSATISPATVCAAPQHSEDSRLGALDGWRAISILSVLACHLLPLGPKSWRLNEMAGAFGMSLFFTLSGFLITTNLYKRPQAKPFFIRRLCRILPLAYLYIIVVMVIQKESPACYASHLLFLINYQTGFITGLTGHFWSLCIEIHFYLCVGLVVLIAGRRGLWILPVAALAITALRILTGTHISIVTHLRADEIMAGAILGLAHATPKFAKARVLLAKVPTVAWLGLLLCASHPLSGAMNYPRPYFAAALVGGTLWGSAAITAFLKLRPLRYIADTSYALYVIHPLAASGWLASGGVWLKYLLKRPLTFLLTFVSAHISTFYYEKKWISWGKRWSTPSPGRLSPAPSAVPV